MLQVKADEEWNVSGSEDEAEQQTGSRSGPKTEAQGNDSAGVISKPSSLRNDKCETSETDRIRKRSSLFGCKSPYINCF